MCIEDCIYKILYVRGLTAHVEPGRGSADQKHGALASAEPAALDDSDQTPAKDDEGVVVWGVKMSGQTGEKSAAPGGACELSWQQVHGLVQQTLQQHHN